MSGGSESRRCKGCGCSFYKNIGCREKKKKKGKLQLTATIYFLYVMADIYQKL